jgi:hypothetical protein
MIKLKNITLILILSFLIIGCRDKSFTGCESATVEGMEQLNCGRIVVSMHNYEGDTYTAIFDDGHTDFTIYLENMDQEKLRNEGVPVWISYSGEKSRSEVRILNYENDEGRTVVIQNWIIN